MDRPDTALFGYWEIPLQAESFSVPGEAALPEERIVWRQDLPADTETALHLLAVQAEALAAAGQALDSVPLRLSRLSRQAQLAAHGGLAFATPPAEPEAELLGLLALVEPQASAGQAVAFGGINLFGAEIDPAALVADFREAAGRIQRFISHLAWVETRLDGVYLAQTALGWSGDSQTSWQNGVPVEKAAVHQAALRNAVRSRLTMLRSLAILGQGALLLSSLITTPAGAALALPAVWKFINNVLAELNRQDISPA